jgi:hypothetical protein
MRKGGHAITSILHVGDEDGARDRVLRTSFWRPSSSGTVAELIVLDAVRAARGLVRDGR